MGKAGEFVQQRRYLVETKKGFVTKTNIYRIKFFTILIGKRFHIGCSFCQSQKTLLVVLLGPIIYCVI